MYDERSEEEIYAPRSIELLNDAIAFFKLIGGADELAERGWKPEAIMDSNYMEAIEDLANKRLMGTTDGYDDGACIMKIDECLEVEKDLTKYFRTEILEMINR